MARKRAVEKLHEIVGGERYDLDDGSGQGIELKNKTHELIFEFDGKGNEFKKIQIRKRVFVEDCSQLITVID